MRGWIIDPTSKTIEAVDINNNSDIVNHIGFDTIESDIIDNYNVMYFDEECFLRQAAGRFQLDKLIPVSGKAVIMGKDADDNMTDVTLSQDELLARLAYM